MPKSAITRTPRQTATPLTGPASLVNVRARQLMTCQGCGNEHVTAIAMTLTDGSRVEFASCHRCETRWWLEGGERLSFDAVIEKTRKIA